MLSGIASEATQFLKYILRRADIYLYIYIISGQCSTPSHLLLCLWLKRPSWILLCSSPSTSLKYDICIHRRYLRPKSEAKTPRHRRYPNLNFWTCPKVVERSQPIFPLDNLHLPEMAPLRNSHLDNEGQTFTCLHKKNKGWTQWIFGFDPEQFKVQSGFDLHPKMVSFLPNKDLSLGIQSPNLRMVMEPKYYAFRRWLDTLIIIWEYDAWFLGFHFATIFVLAPVFVGLTPLPCHFIWVPKLLVFQKNLSTLPKPKKREVNMTSFFASKKIPSEIPKRWWRWWWWTRWQMNMWQHHIRATLKKHAKKQRVDLGVSLWTFVFNWDLIPHENDFPQKNQKPLKKKTKLSHLWELKFLLLLLDAYPSPVTERSWLKAQETRTMQR